MCYLLILYVYAFKHNFVPLVFSHTQEGTQPDLLVHPKGCCKFGFQRLSHFTENGNVEGFLSGKHICMCV